jgi:hypothetical protein
LNETAESLQRVGIYDYLLLLERAIDEDKAAAKAAPKQ